MASSTLYIWNSFIKAFLLFFSSFLSPLCFLFPLICSELSRLGYALSSFFNVIKFYENDIRARIKRKKERERKRKREEGMLGVLKEKKNFPFFFRQTYLFYSFFSRHFLVTIYWIIGKTYTYTHTSSTLYTNFLCK